MKLVRRNAARFETLDLYRAVAQAEGYRFTDPESDERFLAKIKEEFTNATKNPIVLHGLRTQAMFEYVAVTLGACQVIKSEDSGHVYVQDASVGVPDLRVLLSNAYEFLVEVKNFYQRRHFADYRMREVYFNQLMEYAALFNKDLKFAIYWSRWNLWTLTSPKLFVRSGRQRMLSMNSAMMNNEMNLLGDYMVGTVPPLRLRILTDATKPRTVGPDGNTEFTIGGLELYAGEKPVTRRLERNIAFFLLRYGDWQSSDGEVVVEGGQLISFDFIAEPDPDRTSVGQNFQMIGTMSSMASQVFNELTVSEKDIERLSPPSEPIDFGAMIPPDYKGKDLPLWRFFMRPADTPDSEGLDEQPVVV